MVIFDSSAVADANCIRSYGEARHSYFTARLASQYAAS